MTTSTIYDLGYQPYTGERHGRLTAIRTLVLYSLRAAFGIGRGEQARRIPVLVSAIIFAPALIQVGVASAAGSLNFIHYSNYLEIAAIMLAMFAAGQAPELIVTDKSSGVLALYLSRPVRATDYALAKLLALTLAMTLLTLAPQLVLFGGKLLLSAKMWPAFKAEYVKLLPILGGSLIFALFFASTALALSSFAQRRVYGSAAVISLYLIGPALSEVVRYVSTGDVRRYAILINPVYLLSGLSEWLFRVEASRRSVVGRADLPDKAYVSVAAVVIVIAVVVLMLRYRKNEA
jgi:ABC-2 type transport system permease protein